MNLCNLLQKKKEKAAHFIEQLMNERLHNYLIPSTFFVAGPTIPSADSL